jgi:hypothetical protein
VLILIHGNFFHDKQTLCCANDIYVTQGIGIPQTLPPIHKFMWALAQLSVDFPAIPGCTWYCLLIFWRYVCISPFPDVANGRTGETVKA